MIRFLAGRIGAALGVLALAACATLPLPAPEPGTQVTPQQVVTVALPLYPQLWGGVVVGIENRSDHTIVEVVSYPLRNQEPQSNRMTQGRFRVVARGFLDPIDYRVGRRITAYGPVTRTEAGRIGAVDYVFPVMSAQTLHLWPETVPTQRSPGGVTFGIGIGIGL